VLSLAELLDLECMTLCADLRTCDPGAGCISHGIMPVAVALRTAYIIGAVLAQLPVHHNAGSDAGVAFNAWVIYLIGRLSRRLDLSVFLYLLRAHCPQTKKN
jgi:hypothetical protein